MMATPSAPTAPRVRGLALPMSEARRRGRAQVRQTRCSPAGRAGVAGVAAGATAEAGAETTARYPPTATRANGIMLLGSVPRPPNTPRSWTRTQSAAQSTSRRPTAGRSTARCPLARARPAAASATTTIRLTANPCAAAKVPNPCTQDDRNPGWEVCAMPCTMLARSPGCLPAVPDQNPRPGHAWSSAMPARNTPVPASTPRPSRRPVQARSGSAMSVPATAYSSAAPGAPNSQLSPGAKIPPNASPKIHTARPQPTLASPPSRDQEPRAAVSSQIPIPTWIQTAAAAALTG